VRNAYTVSVGGPEGKDHLGDMGVDGRLMLNWILKKCGVKVRIRFNWFRICPLA
jgi:hypothetical protein